MKKIRKQPLRLAQGKTVPLDDGDVSSRRISHFRKSLLSWHTSENNRQMPWKGETDPYKIWLSEVILQQTRVAQGLPYYQQFITAFPTVHALAAAPDDVVFKFWEGLGYYSRCANLLATARRVVGEYNGVFPNTIDGLMKLKGVGEYTAAAIGSFAFGLPAAVVDGNVIRVLSRYFGIFQPFDIPAGRVVFRQLAAACLSQKEPAQYNQAIMDFGAEVCTPKRPRCANCPLTSTCFAFQEEKINDLPVRQKRIAKKERYFRYLVFTTADAVMVRKRSASDVWKNLYEFVLEELLVAPSKSLPLLKRSANSMAGGYADVKLVSDAYHQELTHQRIHAQFVMAKVEKAFALAGYEWVAKEHLSNLAFPVMLKRFLLDHLLNGE